VFSRLLLGEGIEGIVNGLVEWKIRRKICFFWPSKAFPVDFALNQSIEVEGDFCCTVTSWASDPRNFLEMVRTSCPDLSFDGLIAGVGDQIVDR
jgi:hypothetical protein